MKLSLMTAQTSFLCFGQALLGDPRAFYVECQERNSNQGFQAQHKSFQLSFGIKIRGSTQSKLRIKLHEATCQLYRIRVELYVT